LLGYAKNERANISAEELQALQTMAVDWLASTEEQLDRAVADGALEEICDDC
jgi:hypothetical protein